MEKLTNLNVDQEEPQHAVDAGEDPNTRNDPLGPGDCAHRLGPHWMTDSDVPAHWEWSGITELYKVQRCLSYLLIKGTLHLFALSFVLLETKSYF